MKSLVSLEPVEVMVLPTTAILVEAVSGPAPQQIHAAMAAAFEKLMHALRSCPAQPAAPPRAIYTAYTPEETRFTLAYPIVRAPGEPPCGEGVSVGTLPSGRTLRFTHHGPYLRLAETYEAITEWLKSHDRMQTEDDWLRYMPMWEEYVTDPDTTPAESLVTYIYLPLL
jgi:effector-binding domain-containing protein